MPFNKDIFLASDYFVFLLPIRLLNDNKMLILECHPFDDDSHFQLYSEYEIPSLLSKTTKQLVPILSQGNTEAHLPEITIIPLPKAASRKKRFYEKFENQQF